MSLVLILTLVISMSVPSYAGLFDKAVDWGKGAVEDVGDAANDAIDWGTGAAEDVGDAAEDAYDWGTGAVEDVGDAAEDAYDWGTGAVEDVGDAANDAYDWAQGAAEDTSDALEKAAGWTAGAAEDAYNWTEGAVDDTGDALETAGDWLEGAAEDVGEVLVDVGEGTADLVGDLFADQQEISELEKLPVFEIDESKMTNMLDPSYGEFSYLENVRDKKLSSNTYLKIKNELDKAGIPGHIVDFVLEEVAGVEGDNVGEAIADLLPGSALYGNSVAEVINDVINDDSFIDVDLYTETIKSNNDLEGFTAYYDIPVNGELGKNGLVVVTGLKYGKRDDFNVYVKAIDSSGNEKEFSVEKMALNKKEVAFVAKITNITSKIEKIRVEYDNDFDKPKEPSRLIADGLKDGINGATPIFNPISNGARDDMVKVLNKLDMNEIGGNSDVGVIIAENIVGQIPLIGTALNAIGGIDWFANLIRKVIGQVEVKSYAAIRDGRILVKGYTSSSQLNNFVDGSTKESSDSSVKTIAYDYESVIPDFKYLGSGWLPGSTLYCTTNGHANAILNENDYGNVMIESVVNINEKKGNAGIEFRMSDVKGTQNNFKGYLAGIGFNDNNEGKVFLGKQNYDWNVIKEVNAPIVEGKDHILKVIAIGKNIRVYLDGRLYINVSDNTYRDGYLGYQVWNASVNFDNLIISENVPFDLVEYNFSSSKPDMDFDGEEWSYYDAY